MQISERHVRVHKIQSNERKINQTYHRKLMLLLPSVITTNPLSRTNGHQIATDYVIPFKGKTLTASRTNRCNQGCGSRSAKIPPLPLPHRREESREKRNWFFYPSEKSE